MKLPETLDGKILVRIPAGIQTDTKLRIPEKGYIDRQGRRGNLYIKIRIVNPRYITDDMKKLFEGLRDLSKGNNL